MKKKKGFLNIKSQEGFTLLEILAGLAILIVLMSVSVPGIVSLNKKLDMTKADNMAKEIYISAQNKLYYQKASGYLDSFQSALEDASTQTGTSIKIFKECPSDYEKSDDGTAVNSNWENIYYGSSNDATLKFMSYVLPSETESQITGDYIIEANPYTGQVYGVFYKEKVSKNDEGRTLDYLYKESLYSNRDKASRETYLVGYYGGSETGKKYQELTNTDVEVVNGEQLAIELTYNGDAEIITGSPVFCIELTDEEGKTFEDEIGFTSTGSIDPSNSGNTSFRIDGKNIITNADGSKTIRYILDSLDEDLRFSYSDADADSSFGLVPGENITAKVRLIIEDSKGELRTSLECSAKTLSFNSLYADGSDTTTLRIANNRHLNNLRSDRVNVTPFVTAYNQRSADSRYADPTLKIIQTEDIDFDSTEKEDASPDFDEFTSISNSYFFAGNSPIASFDGQGNEIRNYNITAGQSDGASTGTGLFAQTKCDISNVRLVNTAVDGRGNVGTLVGQVLGGTIDHCGAYLLSDISSHKTKGVTSDQLAKYSVKAKGYDNIGGLIGRAEGDAHIVNCFSAVNAKPGAGSSNVGGLIGSVALDGSSSTASIEQCYSSGDIEAGEYAGGLIGSLESGTVKNCYSTSDVVEKTANSSKAGSFVGYASGGKVTSCISYGTVNYGDKDTINSNACAFGNTANNSSNTIFTDCVYFCFEEGTKTDGTKYTKYNTQFSGTANGATATAEPELVENSAREANSHPYDSSLTYFPFKDFVQVPGKDAIVSHYGDWFYAKVDRIEQSAYLVYYEKYEDGSYGYYSEQLGINTLRNYEPNDQANGKYLVEDGYAVLTDEDEKWTSKITYTINGVEHANVNVNNGSNSEVFTPNGTLTDDTTGRIYNVYLMPFSLQYNCVSGSTFSKSGNFYDKLVITKANGKEFKEPVTFFYNPHFAKCISTKDTSVEANRKSPDSNTLVIRSARQLNLLGKLSYYWNSSKNSGNLPSDLTYKQELDIDFGTYNTQSYRNKNISFESGTYANEMIGNDSTPFKYTYDGDSFVIADYKLTEKRSNGSFIGMFGTVTDGELKNINMLAKTSGTDASGTVSSSGKIYVNSVSGGSGNGFAVGGLAGRLDGSATLNNCSISDYVVEVDGQGSFWRFNFLDENMAVGGLVGMVGQNAKVDKSYSVCKYVGFNNILVSEGLWVRTPTVATSGLAGVNYGTISNSYAGSHLYADLNTSWGTGYIRCAGVANTITIAGNSTEGSCTNCYSYSKVDKTSGPSGTTVKKYGISPANNTNSFYYSTNMTDAERNSGTSYNYDQMKALKNNAGFITAGYGSVDGYDLPLIVKNRAGDYIHYAEKPSA